MASDPPPAAAPGLDRSEDVYEGVVQDDGDYTFYLKKGGSELGKLIEGKSTPGKTVYSESVRGRVTEKGLSPSTFVEGRMLVCRCYRDHECAVTLRRLSKEIAEADKARVRIDRSKILPWDDSRCEFTRGEAEAKHPIPNHKVTGLISALALDKSAVAGEPTGLLLVTGSTNSGKSELVRGLIGHLVREQVKRYCEGVRKRRPHLLTYEDPVEKWLFHDEEGVPRSDLSLEYGLEYTPREKGKDVGSLKEAVDDALRQTPSVFYIGEVREDNDWPEVLRFAATGHLVVTTAHAGSLVEAMERIFRAVKAETPAGRGQIAQRILGIVHQMIFNLREFVPPEVAKFVPPEVAKDVPREGAKDVPREGAKDVPGDWLVPLPTLWRRTPSGIAALVSDGLSSILPNNPKLKPGPAPGGTPPVGGGAAPPAGDHEEDSVSCFGRRWFAAQLSNTEEWRTVLNERWNTPAWQTVLNERRRGSGDPDAGAVVTPDLVAGWLRKHFEVEAIRYDLMGS